MGGYEHLCHEMALELVYALLGSYRPSRSRTFFIPNLSSFPSPESSLPRNLNQPIPLKFGMEKVRDGDDRAVVA